MGGDEVSAGIGDLLRDWTIAVNAKRDVDRAREYGQATAADVTDARDRAAAARRAVDEAMEAQYGPAEGQGALIQSEEIR